MGLSGRGEEGNEASDNSERVGGADAVLGRVSSRVGDLEYLVRQHSPALVRTLTLVVLDRELAADISRRPFFDSIRTGTRSRDTPTSSPGSIVWLSIALVTIAALWPVLPVLSNASGTTRPVPRPPPVGAGDGIPEHLTEPAKTSARGNSPALRWRSLRAGGGSGNGYLRRSREQPPASGPSSVEGHAGGNVMKDQGANGGPPRALRSQCSIGGCRRDLGSGAASVACLGSAHQATIRAQTTERPARCRLRVPLPWFWWPPSPSEASWPSAIWPGRPSCSRSPTTTLSALEDAERALGASRLGKRGRGHTPLCVQDRSDQ